MQEKIEFKTSINIDSSIEKVWEVFSETSKYPEWNPFIKAIWGKFELNEKFYEIGYVANYIFLPFPMRVSVYTMFNEITYQGSLPGFFGHHVYKFEKLESNKVLFSHTASFSGFFVNLSKKHITTNVKRVHEDMNLALKKRAEAN